MASLTSKATQDNVFPFEKPKKRIIEVYPSKTVNSEVLMVFASLTHNPYLRETNVSFNGYQPRINSQIEKYENLPLTNWVRQVPSIFHDEMNGYDFDFNFYGTRVDFERIKTAFENAGVDETEVRLAHKSILENTEQKKERITQLLNWLENNPNRQFDFEKFRNENSEIFNASIPYIIVRGKGLESFDSFVGIEFANSMEELASIDLRLTPILFFIELNTGKQFRQDLERALSRNDITPEQLFFIIDPAMNPSRVIRVIEDYGLKSPQIIDRYDHDIVRSYISDYPTTEHVYNGILIFEREIVKLEETLNLANKKGNVTNQKARNSIGNLDNELRRLKAAQNSFVQLDGAEIHSQLNAASKQLSDALLEWRNRKRKVTGENSGKTFACEYERYCAELCSRFHGTVAQLVKNERMKIESELESTYRSARVDVAYRPPEIMLSTYDPVHPPFLQEKLLKLHDSYFVNPRDQKDFLGFFINPADEEPTLIIEYDLDQWRRAASETIMPIVNRLTAQVEHNLTQYHDSLAEAYTQHLAELITIKNERKSSQKSRLSDDEKKLQEDNEWFEQFSEQLEKIKRA